MRHNQVASEPNNDAKAKQQKEEPTDTLSLPLPPVVLDFSIKSGKGSDAILQRYLRKGDSQDASLAVVGKGGFGTAYRYVRDCSFTPPNSTLDNSHNGSSVGEGRRASYQCEGDESMESIQHMESAERGEEEEGLYEDIHLQGNTESPSAYSNRKVYHEGRSNSALSSYADNSAVSSRTRSATATIRHRSNAPAVIVVKVCRTPTSGSYDELPKTGRGRDEAKVAAHQLQTGELNGDHTRIVRGEARLFRYLQMVHSLKRRKGQSAYLVRLLADIPHSISAEQDDQQGGPPIPRLLVFERLVDLDAELTSKGWAKSRDLWTVEKVEAISRDIIAGLCFLHEHHVVHGDLKPSNCMRDPKTGHVKLIDLGASRRWVRLPNAVKERTTAVEELDQAIKEASARLLTRDEILCEGLGSLTGSPHFMAPEVLLQAGRYLAADGYPRSILDDYVGNHDLLAGLPEAVFLVPAYKDFKRGWGLKADIWSWGCTAISLLLRTLPRERRPSSNSICAFDFSFSNSVDALDPLSTLHESNSVLPRFHQWARMYPLRIMSVLNQGVTLPSVTSVFNDVMIEVLQAVFQQRDLRPNATDILQALDAYQEETMVANMNLEQTEVQVDLPRRPSLTRSSPSIANSIMSFPDEPNNIDLSTSNAMSAQYNSRTGQEINASRLAGSQQSFIMLDPIPKRINGVSNMAPILPQSTFMQNRLIHSPLGLPNMTSPVGYASGSRKDSILSIQSAAIAMDSSPKQPITPLTPVAPMHRSEAQQTIRQRNGYPVLQSHSSQRNSTLLDEVFTEAYEHDGRRLSPMNTSISVLQPSLSSYSTAKLNNINAEGNHIERTRSTLSGHSLFRKKSHGLLGLGLDLHKPNLRSARSFNSLTRVISNQEDSITPVPTPNRAAFDDASASGQTSSLSPPLIDSSSFLQHDPFSSSNQKKDPFLIQPYARRGRSWSSIFKRKKVL